MTKEEKVQYREPQALQKVFQTLIGKKYTLTCGHHVTFGYFLGNDIIIRNGKTLEIICLECGR